MKKESIRDNLVLLVLLIIFVAHCFYFNFTQDDAFISYRYVKNFTQGNGLVFNSGEKVEGYTNFLWIIILSIFSRLGWDVILVSKILGVASGCVTLYLLYRISSFFFPNKEWWLALFPSLLLTASSAFAYWSISGLETAFFVMMILLSVYLYLTYSPLWIVSCAVCTLVRPEGLLIFGILLLQKLFLIKDPLKQSLLDLGGFILLLLPFLIFKLFYYGNVLPNPFYAKTGFSMEYVKSGLEYFWLFSKHYGLWGILYLVPIFLYKSLDSRGKLLVWLVYLYTLYVILIGGDVLKVHRFFLPILPFLYLLFAFCLISLFAKFRSSLVRNMSTAVILFLISALSFLFPLRWISETKVREKGLVKKMQFVAGYLKEHYDSSFSIAVSTIGSISDSLGTGVKVIDMLGLTDGYISRHPENIPGITVTWKEKKYNTAYLLSRDPDFILFPTGFKPSAPAEKALFLNSKFRQNYYAIPIFFNREEFDPIFKKKGSYLKNNEVFKDTRFVDLFCEATYLSRRKPQEAIEKLKQVALLCPNDFALVYNLMGTCYFNLKNYTLAEEYLKKAIQIDDCSVLPHVCLVTIYQLAGRFEEAEAEKRKVSLYDPYFQW